MKSYVLHEGYDSDTFQANEGRDCEQDKSSRYSDNE